MIEILNEKTRQLLSSKLMFVLVVLYFSTITFDLFFSIFTNSYSIFSFLINNIFNILIVIFLFPILKQANINKNLNNLRVTLKVKYILSIIGYSFITIAYLAFFNLDPNAFDYSSLGLAEDQALIVQQEFELIASFKEVFGILFVLTIVLLVVTCLFYQSFLGLIKDTNNSLLADNGHDYDVNKAKKTFIKSVVYSSVYIVYSIIVIIFNFKMTASGLNSSLLMASGLGEVVGLAILVMLNIILYKHYKNILEFKNTFIDVESEVIEADAEVVETEDSNRFEE